MKLLKTVPAIVMLAGACCVTECSCRWFRFTVMDDPASAKNLSKVIWTQDILHNQAIRKAPHLRLTPPWLVWTNHCTVAVGNASNTSSNDERSSEKYAAGGRSRFNLTDYDYLFGQASWLTDRYNGYRERDVLTAGYGRQFWMARYTVSALNSVRVRYDKYTDNASETQPLGYASGLMHGSWLTTLNLRRVFPSLARKTQRWTLKAH